MNSIKGSLLLLIFMFVQLYAGPGFCMNYTRLTSDEGRDPLWAQDGSNRILYHTNYHIHVISAYDVDSCKVTSMYDGWLLLTCTWCKDYFDVAFWSFYPGAGMIECPAVEAGDSNSVVLWSNQVARAQYTPVIEKFVFSENGSIYICPVTIGGYDSKQLVVSYPGSASKQQPSWSPDGQWITYSEYGDIHIAPVDGSEPPIRLTQYDNTVITYGPSWSPDGNYIAFEKTRSVFGKTYHSIWVYSLVHGQLVCLVPEQGAFNIVCSPSWSHDGHSIVYYDEVGLMIVRDFWQISTFVENYNFSYENDAVEITWKINEYINKDDFRILRHNVSEGTIDDLNMSNIENDGSNYMFLDRTIIEGSKYIYQVMIIEDDNARLLFSSDQIDIPHASTITLYQNYPNPFNPQTRIEYYLPENQHVILDIYTLKGALVERLIDEPQSKGHHVIEWKAGKEYSSGIYLYRLKANKTILSKKMVIVQ